MPFADSATALSRRAQEEGSRPFSHEEMWRLAPFWKTVIEEAAACGLTHVSIPTPFSAEDCAAQRALHRYFAEEGFSLVPVLFDAGGKRIQIMLTWN